MGKHAAINKKSNNSDNPHRTATKGNMRSKSTIMRLNMYKKGKPVRNKDGKVVGGTLMMDNTAGGKELPSVARIAPDRRWFGNTRVISQKELDSFREEMTTKEADPYSIVLRRKKIPMALLQETEKTAKLNVLGNESFADTFGGKQTRKRPKLSSTVTDYETLLNVASEKVEAYDAKPENDSNIEIEIDGVDARKDDLFSKGQSKRIWGELYKVLDCSDVIIQVLDARNVPGTRCTHIEKHLKKNAPHKHMIIVLNKCDLAPGWVTRKWVKILSENYPTLAFHASITNAFGKGSLISLLRQFAKLLSDKRQISVGVIGYPNTGKSSVINALLAKKSCKTAPVPGETKVWQYIALTKKIFLIDSPGVVYDVGDDETETVLKGVVRAERLENPADYIAPILERVNNDYIVRHYGVSSWESVEDFLSQLAAQKGKLLKGGEPDCNGVARSVINDWQRGKIPFFIAPPKSEGETLIENGEKSNISEDDDSDGLVQENDDSAGNDEDSAEESDESEGISVADEQVSGSNFQDQSGWEDV